MNTDPPATAQPATQIDPLTQHLRELRSRHKPTCKYFSEAERTIDDQWRYIVAPRLETLNPDWSHVLEIACGYGRNTERLLERAERVTAVDIQPHCIEACVARFPHAVRTGKLRLRVNDGLSLPMVESGTVSLAYSFDSLVHMEWPVVERYLQEIARVLKPAGTALLHHSNFEAAAAQRQSTSVSATQSTQAPSKWFDNPHWRSNCSAEQLAIRSRELGLEVLSQDLIRWGDVPDLDAITLLRKP